MNQEPFAMQVPQISGVSPLAHIVRTAPTSVSKDAAAPALPTDGYQSGGQAPEAKAPVAANAAPLHFPEVDDKGYKTLLISAAKNDRGFGDFPDEARDALTALEKSSEGQVRALPVSDFGGGLFESEKVLKVHSSQAKAVEEILAKSPSLNSVNMADLLNIQPSGRSFDETIVAQLKSGGPLDSTQALVDLHELFSGKRPTEDTAVLDKIADGALSISGNVVNLYNATLLEETKQRRAEIGEGKAPGEDVGEQVSNYFEAGHEAIDELREKGRTPALDALGADLQRASELQVGLGTKRALTFQSQLLVHGDGILLPAVVADNELSEKLVDHMIGIAESRLEQTLKFASTPKEERPERLRGPRSSGPFSVLPGGQSSESRYVFSSDCPYDDLPANALTLLGTDQGDMVRGRLESFFLKADGIMPPLQAKHRASAWSQEDRQWADSEEFVKNAPEDQREKIRGDLEKQRERQFESSYEKLTSQGDVQRLAQSLAYLSQGNEEVFSSAKAHTQSARLLTDLIPQLKNPEMHRTLADVALDLMGRANDIDPEVKASLNKALSSPGADPEVNLLAATRLVTLGNLSALPTVVEGLSHPNGEVRRAAMDSLQVVTAVTHDRPVQGGDGLVAALGSPTERMRIQGTLASAVPKLETMLADTDSVWMRTGAASILADITPENPKAIATLRGLLADDGASVPYYQGKPQAKNATVRTTALETLAKFGTHAAAAIPDLEARVQAAELAKGVLDGIAGQREKANGAEYFAQDDPVARAAMQTFLQGVATSGSYAERCLKFLNDPKSPKEASVSYYSRSDYPFASNYIGEIGTLAEAAGKTLAKIKAK